MELDWTKLPARLHYLIQPALEHTRFENEFFFVPWPIPEKAMRDFTELGVRIGAQGDLVHLNIWSGDYPMDQHPEAACLDAMLRILDEFDLIKPEQLSKERISELWKISPLGSFVGLAIDTRKWFPFDDGLELVLGALASRLPKGSDCINALYSFPCEKVLDWIEEHAEEKLGMGEAGSNTQNAGRIAAICGIRWDRIVTWLEAGALLRHSALSALNAFWNYETGPLKKHRPTLRDPPAEHRMRSTLQTIIDTSDPHSQKLASTAMDHWNEIIGGKTAIS